jgi:hypothetical protein
MVQPQQNASEENTLTEFQKPARSVTNTNATDTTQQQSMKMSENTVLFHVRQYKAARLPVSFLFQRKRVFIDMKHY